MWSSSRDLRLCGVVGDSRQAAVKPRHVEAAVQIRVPRRVVEDGLSVTGRQQIPGPDVGVVNFPFFELNLSL